MKTKKKEAASNFYYVPLTGAILHMVIYEDDTAKVYSNFHIKRARNWDASELYNFLHFYDVFGIVFIGKV